MSQLQQGDTIYIPIKKMPNDLIKQKNDIIQHGESTHTHRLQSGEIWLEPKTQKKYLRLVSPSKITHEEHAPIEIPEGEYEVRIVREKDMFSDLIAPIVD